jgi:hypothetical protein
LRHQAQFQLLLSKGYFINEDGTKSTDLKERKKRVIDETKSNASEKTKAQTSAGGDLPLSRGPSIQSNQSNLKKRSKVSNIIDLDDERPLKKIRKE